jgi:hypothetical protein
MNNEQSTFQPRSLRCPVLIGLVVAAVLLRLVITLMLPRAIKWDEASYLLLGSNFFSGNGFTLGGYPEVHFPPLWPLMLGLFYAFTGDFEQASNLGYALFGGLLLLPVFAIAQRILWERDGVADGRLADSVSRAERQCAVLGDHDRAVLFMSVLCGPGGLSRWA